MDIFKNPKIEKIVYFVRHGQSEANISPVFQGPDSSLTESGREQARVVADRLAKLSFEALVSSPWRRARDTAEIISQATHTNVEYSDLFVERVKPRGINGKSIEDPAAHEIYERWEESLYTPGLKVDDGEGFNDLMDRAGQALEYLKNRPEKSLVVITHGFFLRTIFAKVLLNGSLTPENYKNFQFRASMENSGISAIIWSSSREGARWRLWIYN
ncbi:MAG: histidine phosphatase family protein, partial [Patescibacteria group bacterium]|nr:histidine phosphatase family protein [Patescibacteria group bacterium]